jgi:hypothetical protein
MSANPSLSEAVLIGFKASSYHSDQADPDLGGDRRRHREGDSIQRPERRTESRRCAAAARSAAPRDHVKGRSGCEDLLEGRISDDFWARTSKA